MNSESKGKQKQIISPHHFVNRNRAPLKRRKETKRAAKAGRTRDSQSPAVVLQHIQDLLVSPTGGRLDKRQNAASRVKISSVFGEHTGRTDPSLLQRRCHTVHTSTVNGERNTGVRVQISNSFSDSPHSEMLIACSWLALLPPR